MLDTMPTIWSQISCSALPAPSSDEALSAAELFYPLTSLDTFTLQAQQSAVSAPYNHLTLQAGNSSTALRDTDAHSEDAKGKQLPNSAKEKQQADNAQGQPSEKGKATKNGKSSADSPSKSTPVQNAVSKAKTPAGEQENIAAQSELEQQDRLRAEEIYLRMRAERQLHAVKIQALIANLQTEIQRIWEEVALRRQKIHDDMMAKWEKLLFA